MRLLKYPLISLACVLGGCALPVRQLPLSAPLRRAAGKEFVLSRDVRCGVGTGYGRTLRAGTHWDLFGRLDRGDVYRSPDQVLTVEGYDVHQAYLVVNQGVLVGFYLRVERKFTPVSKRVKLPIVIRKGHP